jgi:dGTPase
VGRSLGTLIGGFVIEREGISDVHPQEFGNIVAAACLAHDIGNPPLGHSGEEAISSWFAGGGNSYLSDLTPIEKYDFLKFEGNAQGFRVLARLQNAIDRGGLQLTYAVLGAYSKYPRCAYMPEYEGSKNVSEKKCGYVNADKELFEKLANELGLIRKADGAWSRHPLAFLMEAADDICYRIIDLEDGHRMGRVSFEETEALLKQVAFGETGPEGNSYALIDDERGKVEYLRARAINNLIFDSVSTFKLHYKEIMKGVFEKDLMSQSKYLPSLNEIKMLSRKRVYATPSVLHIEAAGFEVLGGLLEKIVPALIGSAGNKKAAEKKLLQLIPKQFTNGKNQYEQLLSATDYVSGMTDSYAVSLYRRLRGIELPRG